MAVKTIELVWSGTHWCDRITGVKIPDGIYPPPDQQAEAIGTTLEEWAGVPSQSNHHPFDKSFAVTYEQVQKMIDDAFRNRTYQTPYFAGPFDDSGNMLITFASLRSALWRSLDEHGYDAKIKMLNDIIYRFDKRLERIERPWYKRWFSR